MLWPQMKAFLQKFYVMDRHKENNNYEVEGKLWFSNIFYKLKPKSEVCVGFQLKHLHLKHPAVNASKVRYRTPLIKRHHEDQGIRQTAGE